MTYQEAVAYLYGIPRFTKKHTLEHTREFLRRLGEPQKGQRIIHVAGTNGKGSVCAYLQAMLMAEGKRVGFFTSPHLVYVNERIRVNGQQIDNDSFLRAFTRVKETVDGMALEGISHPSYFEFLFGMGMIAFAEQELDYIILETGLGGRLDATNAIEEPVLSVITSISLDHTRYLGDTVEKIAWEKAGIIKRGIPVICDGSEPEALVVLRRQADALGARCREITNHAFKIKEIGDNHIAFSRVNAYDKGVMWQLHNCGIYQAMNASIAIAAMEELLPLGEQHYEVWQRALASVTWEGRMEEVIPGVFVDGAHNPGAIRGFVETIQALGNREKPVFIFAAVEDKDYESMIRTLCQEMTAKAFVVTEIGENRKVSAAVLAEIFRKHTDAPVYEEPEVKEACQKALALREEQGKVYVLGSLYLVGSVKEWLAGGREDA